MDRGRGFDIKTVVVELTAQCNIDPPCVMCPLRNLHYERRLQPDISPERLLKLKPYLRTAQNVFLQGIGGEPLLSSSLYFVLDMLRESSTHIQFDTNGLLLTDEVSRKLISGRLTGLSVSLDAATAQTYRKIRRNNGFPSIIGNIEHLQALKKLLHRNDPELTMSMVLMKENIMEAEDFIELASRLGAIKVVMRLLTPIERNYRVINDDFVFDYEEQMINPNNYDMTEQLRNVRRKADVCGLALDSDTAFLRELWELDATARTSNRNVVVKNGENVFTCDRPWNFILVDIFGNVSFCCHIREQLGNLDEREITDILSSPLACSIRADFSAGRIPHACEGCSLLPALSANVE